jgi:thiol-disulfide isomerase/thioredoxin
MRGGKRKLVKMTERRNVMRTVSLVVRSFLGFVFALTLVGRQAALSGEEPLPRYRLEVGQDLKYSGSDEFKFQTGSFTTKETWRVWVVRQNDDGSWRLVFRHGSTHIDSRGGTAREEVSYAWCDLTPDGALADNDSLGFRMQPRRLLPRLPRDTTALGEGWIDVDRRMDDLFRYKVSKNGKSDDKLQLEVTRESAMNEIYGLEYTDVVVFDPGRGVPERCESRSKQTYGFDGNGEGRIQLDEITTHDAQWIGWLANDAERYFAARKTYEKALKEENGSANEVRQALQKAVADLRAVKSDLKLPDFQSQIDHDIRQHEQMADYYADRANARSTILNQPAANWTCMDLDGKEHALKDYRGRVVVMDFWYRGCGWCIRAMPQMKQIATHFVDKPVTVFGMNTDQVEDDAKFVIEKMRLNYMNLKAKGVPEKYGVRGFPTLLIIDQEGIVRDIHVGYSPELRDDVVKSIERILEKKS